MVMDKQIHQGKALDSTINVSGCEDYFQGKTPPILSSKGFGPGESEG
jgi:hypothetical protein